MSKPLVEITGFNELQSQIQKLATDKEKRAEMVRVLRKVAQGTVRVARQNAPVSAKPHLVSGKRTKKTIQSGALKKSIGVITGKRNNGNAIVYVGPRAKGNFDGWYGHFVEKGHKIYDNPTSYRARGVAKKRNNLARIRTKGKQITQGFVKGKFYMQKTYQQTKGQVTAESEKQVAAYIQKRINQLSTR